MGSNQTAREIADEYELLGIESANQYCRLKRQKPFEEFRALAKHVAFCTLMHRVWNEVAMKLETGPELFENDGENNIGEWGLL